MSKIFYQSSLPRAGSTLLQNIIGQNPEFYVTPTSGLYLLVNNARTFLDKSPEFIAQDEAVMNDCWKSFCKAGMHAFYKPVTDKPYILDKSRNWQTSVNLLEYIHDEAPKIICMLRDPKDVLASMEKNFNRNLSEKERLLKMVGNSGDTPNKRLSIYSQTSPILPAMKSLFENVRTGNDSKILFVKFEDLCVNPDLELARIYEYLELSYFQHDFSNIEQITKEDDEIYGIFGDHIIRPKLEPVTSNAEELFGKDGLEWIYEKYDWFYTRFNYIKE